MAHKNPNARELIPIKMWFSGTVGRKEELTFLLSSYTSSFRPSSFVFLLFVFLMIRSTIKTLASTRKEKKNNYKKLKNFKKKQIPKTISEPKKQRVKSKANLLPHLLNGDLDVPLLTTGVITSEKTLYSQGL